ncbi:penicillin-binding protein [Frondihabitans sucicola]|uniref:Penicillin-binding protein n=1 Tax=Frondihabitans sucicola TaxID=1268041 RepID=A0ABM8GTZ6_9MICO|nr:serine hydrolase domain-containing protein [Frondihabitans sucicola]BDZ51803.1 penicillin-binding protein [Frondihabitans sucicola]
MTIDPSDLRAAVSGVDSLFRARVAEKRAPSAAYGVFTRDGLVHTGSTGDVAGAAPTADTIYRIASCTKSFTATALLALRDAGALDLDAPVTDFVPAFGDVTLPTADSPIPTVRMLLTMSAGLPTDDPWGDRQEPITDRELDTLLGRGLRFDSVPGTRFAYSNLGYALLGRVVTIAAGRPYREVVSETILRPLGLESTGFERPNGDDDRLAIGHRFLDDAWQPLPFSGPGGFSSIGGLFSTVTDLSRWARWLASAFDPAGDESEAPSAGSRAPGDHDGILSRASRRELQQQYRFVPALAAQPSGYGFGLFVEQQPGLGEIVSHSGGYPGFSAHMRWHPASGIGVVAFENATYAQVSVPAATALHGILHDLSAEPVPAVWPEVVTAKALVESALHGATLPADTVSENVELDVPFTHRRAAWARAIDEIGGFDGSGTAFAAAGERPTGPRSPLVPIDVDSGEESLAPSHLVWRLPGRSGRLRVEIRLTPELPPRIQTLTVRTERLG